MLTTNKKGITLSKTKQTLYDLWATQCDLSMSHQFAATALENVENTSSEEC